MGRAADVAERVGDGAARRKSSVNMLTESKWMRLTATAKKRRWVPWCESVLAASMMPRLSITRVLFTMEMIFLGSLETSLNERNR